jgi:hypothetical protein
MPPLERRNTLSDAFRICIEVLVAEQSANKDSYFADVHVKMDYAVERVTKIAAINAQELLPQCRKQNDDDT